MLYSYLLKLETFTRTLQDIFLCAFRRFRQSDHLFRPTHISFFFRQQLFRKSFKLIEIFYKSSERTKLKRLYNVVFDKLSPAMMFVFAREFNTNIRLPHLPNRNDGPPKAVTCVPPAAGSLETVKLVHVRRTS